MENVGRLIQAGRYPLAIAEFQRIVREQPAGDDAPARMAELMVGAADAAAARGQYAEALAYLGVVARWRAAGGDRAGAAELRRRIEKLEQAHLEAQLEFAADEIDGRLEGIDSAGPVRPDEASNPGMRDRAARARVPVAQGDAVGAARHLTADMAGDDPTLLFAIAEIQVRGGQFDRGLPLVERLLERDPTLADEVVRLGLEMGGRQPDAGFLLVELAIKAWMAQTAWSQATSACEDFLAVQPDYVPAVVWLREITRTADHELDDTRVLRFRPHATVPPTSRTA